MEFSNLNMEENNLTTRISEGIYYFKDVPQYYIVYIEEYGEEYVLVYRVQDPKADKPTRAHKKISINKTDKLLPGGTVLSDSIRRSVGDKYEYKTVYEDPLFASVVVHNGRDTITGKYGKGFFERRPEGKIYSNKGAKQTGGDYTGVFISLETVSWGKSYVPLESVIAEYQRMVEDNINV